MKNFNSCRIFKTLIILFIIHQIVLFENIHAASKKNCRERPIEVNIENADIILAGTVRKIERNYSQSTYAAYIQIHRIIKGHSQVYEILNMNYDSFFDINGGILNNHKNLVKKNQSKNVINGKILYVSKFGSKEICESSVKPHDVRIFLLGVDSHKSIYLNSSLIQPRLMRAKPKNSITMSGEYFDDSIRKHISCFLQS